MRHRPRLLRGHIGSVAALAVLLSSAGVLQATTQAASAAPQVDAADEALRALTTRTPGPATVGRHPSTGLVSFFGTQPGRAVPRSADLSAESSGETAARSHLRRYGAAFGVRDEASELSQIRSEEPAPGGQRIVRFQQRVAGVPVEGGELVVQLSSANDLVTITGDLLPAVRITTAPSLTADKAADVARAVVAKSLKTSRLRATPAVLSVLDDRVLGGPELGPTRLVWRVQVRSDNDDVRRLLYVDAHRPVVVLSVDQNPEAKSRIVCDDQNTPPGTPCSTSNAARREGQPASSVVDVNKAYDFAGHVYDFYRDVLGRDSIDGAGMPLISTVRHCPDFFNCPYANAFWNGSQMTYGDGYTLEDDVVGHEMTHGMTERTSNLRYYYQSGAINEALSDIFGEIIDQVDPASSDTSTARWLIGEDLPIGAIRNMANPPASGQPDRMRSIHYEPDPTGADSGGVHTNSGVANKAAVLMTDGGVFNSRSIAGVSGATLRDKLHKVARIHYKAQFLLTSASDYLDLYFVLPAACDSLVGTNGITTGDCAQVRLAVTATEMNLPAANGAAPPAEAAFCSTGSPVTTWYDNLENPSSGRWTTGNAAGSVGHFWYPQYPNEYNVRIPYATSGKHSIWGDDPDPTNIPTGTGDRGDFWIQTASSIPVVPGAFLHFRHSWNFEAVDADGNGTVDAIDGGVVEYSTNDGATWTDAAPLFVNNGYNATIAPVGGTNPLEGRRGFGLNSLGYTSSRLNLAALVGSSVKLRFHIGADNSVGGDGWFIDDVRVYTCSTSRTVKDFNADGRADVAVFRPSNGTWYVRGISTTTWGVSTDRPVPADYTGDGAADVAVFRPSTGTWHVRGLPAVTWGVSTDRPVAADYTGDGRADIAVFRPSTGTWHVRGLPAVVYGVSTDIPVPADYTGDGRADIAVFRPSTGTWHVRGLPAVTWGVSTDRPVAADYTGDGRADVAVFRPSTGTWYVRGLPTITWGTATDQPL